MDINYKSEFVAHSAPVLQKDKFPNGSDFLQHKFIFISYRFKTVSKEVWLNLCRCKLSKL